MQGEERGCGGAGKMPGDRAGGGALIGEIELEIVDRGQEGPIALKYRLGYCLIGEEVARACHQQGQDIGAHEVTTVEQGADGEGSVGV